MKKLLGIVVLSFLWCNISFASPNFRELSNKDLGKLVTKGTVYIECHMTVAKIKKMIAQAENRKAFFKEHK